MKLSIFLVSYFFLLNAQAQDKRLSSQKVPVFIQTFLQQNYPKAKHIHYFTEIKKQKEFIEVEFKNEKTQYSLLFDESSLIETETEITFQSLDADLHQKIKTQLDSISKKYRVESCNLIHTKETKLIEIEIEAFIGEKIIETEYIFDEKGKMISYQTEDYQPLITPF
jgi:hypothetical protein